MVNAKADWLRERAVSRAVPDAGLHGKQELQRLPPSSICAVSLMDKAPLAISNLLDIPFSLTPLPCNGLLSRTLK